MYIYDLCWGVLHFNYPLTYHCTFAEIDKQEGRVCLTV